MSNFLSKFMHFCAGIAIYLVAFAIAKSVILGLIAVIFAAIAKETRDMLEAMNGNNFDLFEIAITIAGGAVGAIALNVLQGISW